VLSVFRYGGCSATSGWTLHPFSTSGELSRHFGRKHLKDIKSGESVSCNLCKVPLSDKMHVQRHAEEIHGTVSPRHSYDRR
jgi:hypothetical protein